jgi:hypothetical protein
MPFGLNKLSLELIEPFTHKEKGASKTIVKN